ncbi:phytase [Cryptococcus neoformans c45]|nr:phytase [Cryptococcus neoformans var. grubii c45]
MIVSNDTPTPSTPLLLHVMQSPSHRSKVYIQQYRSGKRRHPLFLFLLVITPITLITLVTLLAWDTSPLGHCYIKPICRALKDGNEMEEIWWRNQGPYAPYKELDHSKNLESLPRGCEVDQVTLLHRHTSRYPTANAGRCMLGALSKIRRREIGVPRHHPELSFIDKADLELKDWQFDGLTNQGRKAAWRSGVHIAIAYKSLLDKTVDVFTRSSGGERVLETSGYWLEGFRKHRFAIKRKSDLPKVDVIIPEEPVGDNRFSLESTLSVHSCPAFETLDPSPGSTAQSDLSPLLSPAIDRLNTALRPKPKLDADDVACLADMCGYDSQSRGTEWKRWSKWCGLFTKDEWEVLGHGKDLKRYYEVGQGSDYGPTMGAGYINEIIARLTDSAPQDNTSTNRTLDADEHTFPRGGERFFVDFGHDNEMLEVMAAAGVLKQPRPLATTEVPARRTFILSRIVPFGARLIFERISCDTGYWEPGSGTAPEGGEENIKKYVRILLNDKIQRVAHIACEQSAFAEHGLCEVDAFVESQQFATTNASWDICYNFSREEE